MDEGARQASEVGTTGTDGERTPEEIQREIEATRAELGDTVEALADKADVKGRAKERIDELKARAPDGAQQAGEKARQNPLPLAVGGALVAGFLIGRMTAR